MTLNIIIIIFLLFGILVGIKQGFTKSLVSMVGTIIVCVLAFCFKSPLGNFLASVFPFFSFGGLTALNILLYQMIAFILLTLILTIALKVLLYATSIFEKLLNATIILGIASKILGGVVGFVKNYIIAFIILYILSFPVFSNVSFLQNSSVKSFILNHTFILSKASETMENVTTEINEMANDEQSNEKLIKILSEYNIIDDDMITKLNENGKMK